LEIAGEYLAGGDVDYASAMAVLPDAFGFKEIPVKLAKRGDIVLLKHRDNVPALGIVSLDGSMAVAPGPNGLVFIEVKKALKAWTV
jgi:TPP-dependent trihydroxycyclohexane-1,2-dione (THcHDO) dehydratase